MSISRRKFNQYSTQFLLASLFPVAFAKLLRPSLSEAEITQHLKTAYHALVTGTELLVPTYLGNPQRRFYGRGVPQGLNILNQFPLGTGVTYVGKTRKVWSGAGWTGQPTITRDQGKLYLIIGSYDHHLRKIDFQSNKEVWRYKFDDVIKGTASIYIDETANEDNKIVILQGSRTGRPKKGLAPSLRAISFRTGQEIWKLDIRKTISYSQDNDSSALALENNLIFNVAENGMGYFLNKSTEKNLKKYGFLQPEVISELKLYQNSDRQRQGRNLVAESSPAQLDNQIFIAAGSGHIYGIDIDKKTINWDFYTGSDLDGTVAISKTGHLFCAIPAANGNYYHLTVEQVDHFKPGISFEATPVVWDGKVMICGRDGWLYTLGG